MSGPEKLDEKWKINLGEHIWLKLGFTKYFVKASFVVYFHFQTYSLTVTTTTTLPFELNADASSDLFLHVIVTTLNKLSQWIAIL